MKWWNKTYETILVLTAALVVCYFINHRIVFLYLAGALLLLSVVIPKFREMISYWWLKLAEYIGWVMSKVILTVIFFTILLPIALLSRMFGKPTMLLNKKGRSSYYTDRPHVFEKKDLENVW